MKKYILVLLFLLICICNITDLYAGEIIKEWKADNMPVGEIETYDGLIMIPGGSKLKVQNKNKKYDDNLRFSKCINTGGASSVYTTDSLKYIPKSRAIKFSVDSKCLLKIYAFSASTVSNQTITVSRNSETLYMENISDNVEKICIGLPAADTYYIYSQQGAIGVCMIQIEEYETGDLNFDGKFDENDIMELANYLNDKDTAYTNLKYFADINNDGSINQNDRIKLENLYYSIYGVQPMIYSDKAWNMTDIAKGLSTNGFYLLREDMQVDGLTFYSADGGENPNFNSSEKKYENLNFEYAYNTAGQSQRYERGLSFNTNGACTLTIMVRTATSATSSQTLCISRDSQVVKRADLLNSFGLDDGGVQVIKVYMDKAGKYQIYSPEGAVRIYYISLSSGEAINNSTIEKEIYSTEGMYINEYITVENLPKALDTIYTVKYDGNILEVIEIGFGEKKLSTNNINISDDVEIVSSNSGLIIFKVNKDATNLSGIVTPITFKGKKIGNTKIKIGMDYKSN